MTHNSAMASVVSQVILLMVALAMILVMVTHPTEGQTFHYSKGKLAVLLYKTLDTIKSKETQYVVS